MLTHYQTKIVLGSKIDLVVVSRVKAAAVDEVFRQLWLAVFEFEKRCSRFLPASELSQFNRAAGVKQSISPEFRAVLAAAQQMSQLCDGLYNPFILPALQRAGYVQSMVKAHRDDVVDDFSERGVAGPDQLEVSDTWARIPYGTAIDLGGCGKGFAGDLLADLADTFPELSGYWFSLGGDIVTGGLDESGKPWIVNIESMRSRQPNPVAKVLLPGPERYAVASSSVARRKGTKNGKAWHHIIDPRTGKPALSDTVMASVCGRTALTADVLASCAIIVDPDEAATYLKKRGVVGAVLQAKDHTISSWGKQVRVINGKGS
jgi:thiamine biosynthesis lipoprotein